MGCYVRGLLLGLFLTTVASKHVGDKNIEFRLNTTESGIVFSATLDHVVVLEGILAVGRNTTKTEKVDYNTYKFGDVTLKVDQGEQRLKLKWLSQNIGETFEDCFTFKSGVHWFGGPERSTQIWPLDKMVIDGKSPYVIKRSDNFGVAERYWLNSKGAFIFLKDEVPLYVDQNSDKVCFIAKIDGPYVNRTRNFLQYTIGVHNNIKDAHLYATKHYLGRPKTLPDLRMVREPIWTSWAKYKRDINDEIILSYADTIRNQGYTKGQLEIDDKWETCYGSQVFNKAKFGNISNTVAELHKKNFRVSLWIHPFVNAGCETEKEGLEKGYFVKSVNGSTKATWWNSDNSHQIDFTNKKATQWFSTRVKTIQQNTGIDSFKFDGGETDYTDEPSLYPHAKVEEIPNTLTSQYVRNDATFGKLIEVRSAWRTQDLPIFLRMLDKDSVWTLDNGLATLITTLLQLNINGYSFILPDMIGGNGYAVQPDAELIVRWTQANTFMPAMQFSYLPWEFNAEGYNPGQIVKKFVDLHEKYSDEIIAAMNETLKTGQPTNPPIWWVAHTDEKALVCDDEYMLGDKILVAPVIVKGATSRNVYLPAGRWRDGNNETVIEGPKSFVYNAPIDVLPYFLKL